MGLLLEDAGDADKAARARGRKGGRPKRLDEKKRKLAVEMYRERKHSIEEICDMMEITKPTLYRYIREAGSLT
ncbi:MAG: helix-turn-helix domain-containing protein [Dehalococcoidia bacterium]